MLVHSLQLKVNRLDPDFSGHAAGPPHLRLVRMVCPLTLASFHPNRAVGALLAFYIVRRRRRQRLADAELKGFGSPGQGMAEGEVDEFIDVNSFPGKPTGKAAAAAAAAAGAAGGVSSYPIGSAPQQPGTPTPVSASATSAAEGTSRWVAHGWMGGRMARVCVLPSLCKLLH